MRASEKDKWTTPEISKFADPEEVWERYKDRGTPEQRVRLRAMLDTMVRRGPRNEVKLRRAS